MNRAETLTRLAILCVLSLCTKSDYVEYSYNQFLSNTKVSRVDIDLQENLNEFLILRHTFSLRNFEEYNLNPVTLFISSDPALCSSYSANQDISGEYPDYYQTSLNHDVNFSELYPRQTSSKVCLVFHDPLIWRNLSAKYRKFLLTFSFQTKFNLRYFKFIIMCKSVILLEEDLWVVDVGRFV